MPLKTTTDTGIDISHVLEQAECEYLTDQVMEIKYDEQGVLLRGNGIPVHRCIIRNRRTGKELTRTTATTTNDAIEQAVVNLITITGIEPVAVTEEAKLRKESADLKSQMAVIQSQMASLINAMATGQAVPVATNLSIGVDSSETPEADDPDDVSSVPKTTGRAGKVKTLKST